MPTSKQRRETARRRLERQIQHRQEASRRRRRRNVITGAVLGVVVVVGGVWLIFARTSGTSTTTAATPSASASASASASSASATPTPSRPAQKTSGPCGYAETNTTLTNPSDKNVGLPPDPTPTPATGTAAFTLTTNRGPIVVTLDRSIAPCTVQSFAYLAGKKFLDGTKCHRLVTTGIYVLQCGDPTGTGQGGPSYQVKDENLAKAAYNRGAVAMANAGPGTDGSQFFIIYKNSTSLPKNYTMIGTVTGGLDIVDTVAKAGSNNANGSGDGAPKNPVTIITARIAS